jgi:predicted nucleic acid-binding protein
VIYWDTSALIKLYVPEPDSATFLHHMKDTETPPVTADITSTEVLCTLYRKETVGDIIQGGADILFKRYLEDTVAGRIVLVPNGRDVTTAAQRLVSYAYSQPKPTYIRSLDALHVASALAVNAEAVIATDKRLRKVAVLMGLQVVPKEES